MRILQAYNPEIHARCMEIRAAIDRAAMDVAAQKDQPPDQGRSPDSVVLNLARAGTLLGGTDLAAVDTRVPAEGAYLEGKLRATLTLTSPTRAVHSFHLSMEEPSGSGSPGGELEARGGRPNLYEYSLQEQPGLLSRFDRKVYVLHSFCDYRHHQEKVIVHPASGAMFYEDDRY